LKNCEEILGYKAKQNFIFSKNTEKFFFASNLMKKKIVLPKLDEIETYVPGYIEKLKSILDSYCSQMIEEVFFF
jgi:phosphorylcholine metabolism protein LicD